MKQSGVMAVKKKIITLLLLLLLLLMSVGVLRVKVLPHSIINERGCFACQAYIESATALSDNIIIIIEKKKNPAIYLLAVFLKR